MRHETLKKTKETNNHCNLTKTMEKKMLHLSPFKKSNMSKICLLVCLFCALFLFELFSEVIFEERGPEKCVGIRLNGSSSFTLDEKHFDDQICFTVKFDSVETMKKFINNLSNCKLHELSITPLQISDDSVKVLLQLNHDYHYKVRNETDIIQITLTPRSQIEKQTSNKIEQIAYDLDNLVNNLSTSAIEFATLDRKDNINNLDKSISKLKVEKELNELRIAKQQDSSLLITDPPAIVAQRNQDTTGTQSLSVGNVGTVERNIEIMDAQPVVEQPPRPDQAKSEHEEDKETKSSETPSEQQPSTPEESTVEPPKPRESVPELAVDATAELTKELRELEEVSGSESKSKEIKQITIDTKSELELEPTIKPSPKGLDTIIDFECEKMPLSKVVSLLAYKAGINVVAGTALKGEVTMSLKQVTLRKAIETCLKMHDLGLIQEDNIYRIVPYEEALESDRSTVVVKLENAKASEIKRVLDDIKKGTRLERYITVSANDTTNVVIVSGPEEHIQGLSQMARELDIAKPVIPTVTTTIKLNYSDAEEMAKAIQKILTPRVGVVSPDSRARNIIVTDYPVVVEQVKEVVKNLDIPVKQVLIDTMVVDASLDDEAQTGIDWLLRSVRHQSWRDFVMYGPEGPKIGNLQQFDLEGSTLLGDAIGKMTFSILSNEIDWKGIIQAEIRNQNGHLISNPVVATIENKPATITISQEIPYIDLSQTAQGGAMTNTRFKQVGTVLEVTPRVTHDNHIIIDIKGKESTIVGEFNGVPIEDLRQVTSTLHINNGQTIFVGGLRKRNDTSAVKKMPVIGDIPVLGMVFKTNKRNARINELLIFLTCSVVDQELPSLNEKQQKVYDEAKEAPMSADVQKYLWNDLRHPKKVGEPPYKFRRAEKDKDKECKKEEK